jgi:sterol desaturase/sphingolipid hydroxylase (fatty acid hydroxylase superfamily)
MNPFFELIASRSLWFFGLFVLFALLARMAPVIPHQPLIRRGWVTDLLYYFYYPLFFLLVMAGAITLLSISPTIGEAMHRPGILSTLPLYAQVPLALLLADFMGYWLHRMMHTPRLWRFHRIHHSSEEMDWLSYARFHPVDFVLYYIPAAVVMMFLGFSPETSIYIGPFILFYSGFLHANLRCALGPLRGIVSSPAFHRWHHTTRAEGQNKNFAPTFAFYDRLFGTYYFPYAESPDPIGVTPPIADDLASQLRDPFGR